MKSVPLTMDEARRKVAISAMQYDQGLISLDQFTASIPEEVEEDPDVDELIYLIIHVPKHGGFLGVSPEHYARHMAEIRHFISRLSGSEPIELPGIWPPAIIQKD